MIALAAAAGATSKLRLGTGVALVPVHDAVTMAKSVATLDWTSDGRFEFGIGYGWNAEEYLTHGVDIKDAPDIMREKIALMCELWNNDVGSYEGKYVRVEPSWSWPKPAQQPRPPIHIGARATKAVFADIAAYADGWIPIEGYGDILSQMPKLPKLPKLHSAFEEAGRSPSEARISVYSSSGDPELVEAYATAGIDRVIITLPPTDEAEVMSELERHTKTLERYIETTP